MRKVTSDAVCAFMSGRKFSRGNTTVVIKPHMQVYDGKNTVYSNMDTMLNLHGNTIAYKSITGRVFISACGWFTATTKERLNGLPNVDIRQKHFQWYLNGKAWDGELIEVK